jgi:hypothetical protein
MFYITSWSEWNEGTNIEPSKEFRFDYLNVVKKALKKYTPITPTKDIVKFQFQRLWNSGGATPRWFAAAFDYVKFLDINQKVLLEIDIGTTAARKYMGIGWYYDEGAWGTDVKNFAWAGEEYKYATLHLNLPAGTKFIQFFALQVDPPESITVLLNSQVVAKFSVETPFKWTVYQAEIQ